MAPAAILNFGFYPITLNGSSTTLQIWHRLRHPRTEHGGVTKIDKNQHPRLPPAAILNFGFQIITFERFEQDPSNLAQNYRPTKGKWRNYQNWQKSKSKIFAARRL